MRIISFVLFTFVSFVATAENSSSPQDVVVKTLNNMGYMALRFDEITEKFIAEVSVHKGTYLDAGAAYGSATIAALKAGAKHVYANDLESAHIAELTKNTPPDLRSRLTTFVGDFPGVVNLSPNSLDGILMARLLHFFDGSKIELCLKIAYAWLKPGGKIFIIINSPHIRTLAPTWPEIEKRKLAKEKWPGYFNNIWELVPSFKTVTPPAFHVISQEIMERCLKEAGFTLVYANGSGFTPWAVQIADDSVEILGFVAEKR